MSTLFVTNVLGQDRHIIRYLEQRRPSQQHRTGHAEGHGGRVQREMGARFGRVVQVPGQWDEETSRGEGLEDHILNRITKAKCK